MKKSERLSNIEKKQEVVYTHNQRTRSNLFSICSDPLVFHYFLLNKLLPQTTFPVLCWCHFCLPSELC